jgi:cholesterol transport system auxiliary component
MNASIATRWFRCCTLTALVALNSGCSMLFPKPTPQPAFYTLDGAPTADRRMASASEDAYPAATLVIYPPRAAAGFDSQRIIYLRQDHQLEYFARSQWIDTPARMLAPLLVVALKGSDRFDAVLLSASGVAGDLRLDTEILRLQQDFRVRPSVVRFTLRVNLVDRTGRNVLVSQDLDASVATASDDPYAGVVAANTAVQSVLEQLNVLCATAVQDARWPRAAD